jgi:Ca2+-binding EF-hand superfamily protein
MQNISKMIKLGLVVASSLSILVSNIIAEDLPNKGPIEFSSYDTNKDGFVSEKEFNDLRAKRMEQNALDGKMMKNIGNQPAFSDIDTNNDGNISKEEFLAHKPKPRQ